MRTTVQFVERESLTPVQITHMWEIYKGYYNYTHASFLERIETNTLYALYVKGDKICGFTGLRINELRVDGKNHFLIYFGQTILPWGLKGKQLFTLTTAQLILKFWKKMLLHHTWVWYDALSFKAYWIPAKVVGRFYPNCTHATPVSVEKLMNKIGKQYYGDSYCEETNIVTKPKPFVKLTQREIPTAFLSNPHVAFYATRNPGYKEGHGLLTIVPLTWCNISIVLSYAMGRKMSAGIPHSKQQQLNHDQAILKHENSKNNLPAHPDTPSAGLYSIQ